MGLGETDVLRTCALRDMDTQGPLAGAGLSNCNCKYLVALSPLEVLGKISIC